MTTIGIYGVSTKSGLAYLADLLLLDIKVYGYARSSRHGVEIVDMLNRQGGIHLQRPWNNIGEEQKFIPLINAQVGHDLERLVDLSHIIIIAHPSNYHEETAKWLQATNKLNAKGIPLVLSPSRTLAAPYLWRILGDLYPIISFQTCPYSCKSDTLGSVYIKRRKKSWIASVDGRVREDVLMKLKGLIPQMVISRIPATTSLGNIGAVFHPAAYLLNIDAINAAESKQSLFSFYIDGIANNEEVGNVLEEIDQTRLSIAQEIGLSVFGLEHNPREDEWATIMESVRKLQVTTPEDIYEVRRLRARYLQPIHNSIVSAQHWLDYTYGVKRIPGESLGDAIGRTPTYQKRSYPQERYIHEDIPTGLVPLESLAKRLDIPHGTITRIIDLYQNITGIDARKIGRNLESFDTKYLIKYLLGELLRDGDSYEEEMQSDKVLHQFPSYGYI